MATYSHSIYLLNHIVINQKSHCIYFRVNIYPCSTLAQFYVCNCNQIPIIKVDRYKTLHFIDPSDDELSSSLQVLFTPDKTSYKYTYSGLIRSLTGTNKSYFLFLQTLWKATIKLIIQDSNKYHNYPFNLISPS